MQITFDGELIRALLKAGVKSPVFRSGTSHMRTKDIESRYIDTADFKLIRKIASQPEFAKEITNRRVVRKLNVLERIGKLDKDTKIKKLELLPDAIRAAIEDTPKKWLFREECGVLMPWFVSGINFHKAEYSRGGYEPARVTLHIQCVVRGKIKKDVENFRQDALPNTPQAILANGGFVLATQEMVDEFNKEFSVYEEESQRTGEQYLARGSGRTIGTYEWSRDVVYFERDGKPSKVVMDDEEDQKEESDVADTSYWNIPQAEDEDVEDDEESDAEDDSGDAANDSSSDVELIPTHPVVAVFSLSTHQYVETHISSLERYKYDVDVINKLVLPANHKTLIDALTDSAIQNLSDIISGKAQGVIILCSGPPGCGKTLTAEVYSEAAERPLYTVQCSQLGTNEEALEKHLGIVLERAMRWQALLLIDEADVYIHERGDNIRQNAIVGVFLRLLEYYNGILFMTTNRATIIDDAIVSRATAHIKYVIPTGEDRNRIWRILLEQYGVGTSDGFVAKAVETFPNVSGRTIRQLIRLGLILYRAQEAKGLKLAHLLEAAKFHDFDKSDEEQPSDPGHQESD